MNIGSSENPSGLTEPVWRPALGIVLTVVLALTVWTGQAGTPNDNEPVSVPGASAKIETGVASYYADKYHGNFTASGEVFDMHELTAAHRSLPFGTRLKVTNLKNQRTVLVRINDRGPFVEGRVIDLSLAAARELQMIESGLANVRLEIVAPEVTATDEQTSVHPASDPRSRASTAIRTSSQ